MSLELPSWAPGVTFTVLEFGGAVLLHGPTLGVTEYGERDAWLLTDLLTTGRPTPEVRPVAEPLIRAGWLLPPSALPRRS